LEDRCLLTTYLIDSLGDTVAEDIVITLREAIEAANTNVPVGDAPAGSDTETDVIQFDPSLTGGTITLGGSQLTISEDLEIQGLGSDRLTIDANDSSRIFEITGASTVARIDGIRLTGGNAADGGAVRNEGELTLWGVIVENSRSDSWAGAIYNSNQLVVRGSAVRRNTTGGPSGGTIHSDGGGTMLLIDSAVYENSGDMGRGVSHLGTDLAIINSTISGNSSSANGGGVGVGAGIGTIIQSTITDNIGGPLGGGLAVDVGASAIVKNTVVARNTATDAGPDVYGTFDVASDYNVIGMIDDSSGLDGANTQSGTAGAPLDAMLGHLTDNGGPTPTHLPWNGSPLIDAGNNDFALDESSVPLDYDQRGEGFDRILDGTVDVGAVEGSRPVHFSLTDPVGARIIGEPIDVVWDPDTVPVNSTISLYYDADDTLNDNEEWFVENAPAPDTGAIPWNPPLTLLPGDYYVGGTLTAPDGSPYDSRLSAMSLTVGGTTYTVTSPEDNVLEDGLITLREAVLAADTNAAVADAPAGSATSADLIDFDPALAGETIVLAGTQMALTDDLAIVGPGRDLLAVNADGKSRIFSITDPTPEDGDAVRVGISGLTLSNGDASDDGGAAYNSAVLEMVGVRVTNSTAFDDGGGIFNSGRLTVADSIIDENSATGSENPSGGGVFSQGEHLELRDVELSLNVAYDDGAGLMVTGGTVEASGLTFSMNTAFDRAGGLYVTDGTVQIQGAVFSQNTSYTNGGGAYFTGGSVTLSDALIDDNSVVSGSGGGLRNDSGSTVEIVRCTISNNAANYGGGIYDNSSGTLTIRDGRILSNTASTEGGGLWDRYGTTQIHDTEIAENYGGTKGGGVYQHEVNLAIYDSRIAENEVSATDAWGGGVYSSYRGSLAVYRSDIVGNQVEATDKGYGGGVCGESDLPMTLADCTIADNRVLGLSEGRGAGIWYQPGRTYTGTLNRCTIAGNVVYGASTSLGGGVFYYGTSHYQSGSKLHLVNSTVSGNRSYGSASASGGGLYLTGSSSAWTYITQGTITLNDAAYGGGVYRDETNARIHNSIVAGNTAEFSEPDVCGAFHGSSGANLIGIVDGSSGLSTVDSVYGTGPAPLSAGLGALADNGAYSKTHALLTASPAADAGNNAYAVDQGGDPLNTDQTGGPRVENDTVDMGAYEGSLAPEFGFAGPTGAISGGVWQALTWNAQAVSADGRIAIYADPDDAINDNEIPLLEDGDPNVLGGQWDWAAVDLPEGTYTLGATVTDRITGFVVSERLATTTELIYDNAYLVSGVGDDVAVDGVLTLREAIAAAAANQPVGDAHAGSADRVDVILFSPALSGSRITLAQGELPIDDDLSIQGLGQESLEISGDNTYRVFGVAAGVRAWLSDLTIRDGYASNEGGNLDDDGGGINNYGDLLLHDVTLTGNVAFDDGGGIMNRGSLRVSDCVFVANTTQGSSSAHGGGLFNSSGDGAVIENTLIHQNTAGGRGGGICNNGSHLTLRSVILRKNTAFDDGGGLWTQKYFTLLEACSIAENLSFDCGGGICLVSGPMRFLGSTASDNSAKYGGGIYDSGGATLTIRDGRILTNTASTDGGGLWDRYGNTRIHDTEISGNSGGSRGGGIWHDDTNMAVYDSRIAENRVSGDDVYGGGVYCESGGWLGVYRTEIAGNQVEATNRGYGGAVQAGSLSMSLVDCTIADNRVSGLNEGRAGGIWCQPSARYGQTCILTRCTVSGNVVYGASISDGGGIYYTGTSYYQSGSKLHLVNSTVSGNRAYGSGSASGGGLYLAGSSPAWTYITHGTITLNDAAYGGGVYRDETNVRIHNTIVAGNTAEFSAPDVSGAFHGSSGANLIGIVDGSSGLSTVDSLYGTGSAPLSAGLGALADNGGHTRTHALFCTSPAVNAGNNGFALDQDGNPITADQRGEPRIWAGTVDMGPYEGCAIEAFEISGPEGLVEAGTPAQITWTGGTIGADTRLSIYADPDGLINGNETYLLRDANPNPLAGSFTWHTVDVPEGTYTLGASVVDRITSLAVTDRTETTVTVSYANAYLVDSTADAVGADGLLTLREAIEAANVNATVGDAQAGHAEAVDVILFAPELAGEVIELTSGGLQILDDLCIQGLGDDQLTVASDGTDRLFDVAEDINAWLWGLRLTGGYTTGDGGAVSNRGELRLVDVTLADSRAYDDGGALANFGTLTGRELTFLRNQATGGSTSPHGGAVCNWGLMRLEGATFTGNMADARGGAFYAVGGAGTYLSGGSMTENNASDDGGAILSAGFLVVADYSFSDNSAADAGGAICMTAGSASFDTIAATGNSAVNGGAVYNSSGGSLVIQNAELASNVASSHGGGIYDNGRGTLTIRDGRILTNTASTQGGGLWDCHGTTRIHDTEISGNAGGSRGGGIWHDDTNMAVYDSRIAENRVFGDDVYGGGVHCESGGWLGVYRTEIAGNQVDATNRGYGGAVRAGSLSMSLVDCTIADNRVSGLNEGRAGGIWCRPSARYGQTCILTRCTVSGNVVYGASISDGGGIHFSGTSHSQSGSKLHLVNSTVSGNRAFGSASASGGGLYLTGSSSAWTHIAQGTITLNDAAYGGGVYRDETNVRMHNTIVAGNTAEFSAPDASGAFHSSSGANLIGIVDGSTNLDVSEETIFGTAAVPLAAGLAALADNGGLTYTHALLADSPAVNAADNTYAVDENGNPLTTDQRSGMHLRIIDGTTDIGAFEGQADPYFALLAPSGGAVPAAWDTPIRWTGNVPTSSLISIYYDVDSELNGNETYIFRNRPYIQLRGEYLWQSVQVAEGTYEIGAVVIDPVEDGYWEDRTPPFDLVHQGVPTLYVVNTTADLVAQDGVISLREALQAANTNTAVGDAPAGDPVEMDVIRFDPALAGRTITLGSPLLVTNHLAIEGVGEGPFRLTLDANETGRVFEIADGTTLQLADLRLTRGTAGTGSGGAILSAGDLELEDMELFANSAAHGGGVANSGGEVRATRVWVHDNTATDGASRGGGLLSEWGRVEMLDSCISANTAKLGGGLYSGWYGEMLVTSSTVSGNTVDGSGAAGGGIHNTQFSQARLVNVTVKANTAAGGSASGGGTYHDSGSFRMVNTIVAGNTAPGEPDVRGDYDPTSDHNLIGIIDGSTGLDSTHSFFGTAESPLDSGLDELSDNGGPTPTHAIQTGSDAINAGDDTAAVDFADNPLQFDQRGDGHERIRDGRIDLGAFEYAADPGDNQAPVVGGLALSEDPVVVGDPITLTATGVEDDHGVMAVTFYRDTNGDGVPDVPLGTGADGSDGWSWTGSVTWPVGQTHYLAQATDDGWPLGVLASDYASAVGTVIAATPPAIDVGSHDLLAGEEAQRIEVYVTGLDQVTGLNLYAQIGDGPGGAAEPVFASIEFAGGIWDGYPHTITGGPTPGAEQRVQASLVFDNSGDEVQADGLLVTLVVDTRGFSAGEQFDLRLSLDPGGQQSQFILYDGHTRTPTMVDGRIRLFEASVVRRWVFYNDSAFDSNDPAADEADNDARATDKEPLLPGNGATLANYTSSVDGINGVMVDLRGADPEELSENDFEFWVGNSSDLGEWVPAPPSNGFRVGAGEGTGNSDRVTFTWPNGAICNKWLQVTVRAEAIGLAHDDLFYFGNAVGDTGNSDENTYVNATDYVAVRDHFTHAPNWAGIESAFDFNRDNLVNGSDMAIVRDHSNDFLNALKLIDVPETGASSKSSFGSTTEATGAENGGTAEIIVGTHQLVAGQPNQAVPIMVTSDTSVAGFNLYAQIGDGRGGQTEPVFQEVDFSGSIWEMADSTSAGGPVAGAPQYAQAWAAFQEENAENLVDGLLVTLLIDTTEFEPGQVFDLKLAGSDIGVDSAFVLNGGDELFPSIVNGQIEIVAAHAEVLGRHVFYNNSKWDGNDPEANDSDDNAIAPDPASASDPALGKTALRPGGSATFQNYTSYWRGINGIMVDVANLANASGLRAADFEFRVSNRNNRPANNTHDPSSWAMAPTPGVSVREGAGAGGSDRVTLIWSDQAIHNQWLKVTVKANTRTGLGQNDVFYVGNAIGECGDATGFAFVDGADFAGARDNTHDSDDRAPVDDRFDYNRDSLVDGTDLTIARENPTNFLTCLTLIAAPPLGSSPSSTPSISSSSPTSERTATVRPLFLERCLADQEPGAIAGISGSDGPTHCLVDRPCLRPRARQSADLPQHRTEDFDPQTVSAIFQNLETDGRAYASDSALQTTADRWLNAVDDFFQNDDGDLFTW